jgi:hypothetical protein
VAKQVRLVAAGIFKGISHDRQSGQVEGAGGQFPLLVSGLSQGHHLGRQTGRGDGHGAEGAEEVAEQGRLGSTFDGPQGVVGRV